MDPPRRKRIHDAMTRLADGERAAFPVLLDDLWPVILSFAKRGVGHEADAEDVAQEVFFKICSRIADFDRTRDGLSWAFGIAGYEIMTHRRRAQRRRETHDVSNLPELADSSASQEELFLQRELAAAFAHAVGELSEEDQRTLGLLGERIAADVSGPALRKRRQRALDRLRTLWRNLHGEP